jgi:hypothetical protein
VANRSTATSLSVNGWKELSHRFHAAFAARNGNTDEQQSAHLQAGLFRPMTLRQVPNGSDALNLQFEHGAFEGDRVWPPPV